MTPIPAVRRDRRGLRLLILLAVEGLLGLAIWLLVAPPTGDQGRMPTEYRPDGGDRSAVEADPFRPATIPGMPPPPKPRGIATQPFTDPGNATDPAGEFIEPNRSISGKVKDPSGRLIISAVVELHRSGERAYLLRHQELGSGFHFRRLDPGAYDLWCSAHGYQSTVRTLVLDPTQSRSEIDIILQPAPSVLVLLVTPEGRPFLPELRRRQPTGPLEITVLTTREGRLTPRPATFRSLKALALGPSAPWQRPQKMIEILTGSPDSPLVSSSPGLVGALALNEPLPQVGHISLDGKLLAEAEIPAGTHEWRVEIPLEAVLGGKGSVRFNITSSAGNTAPSDTWVRIDDQHFCLEDLARHPDGAFSISGLEPGSHRFDASAQGHVSCQRKFLARANETTDLGVLSLHLAVAIAGTVKGVDGQGVRARIQVHPMGNDRAPTGERPALGGSTDSSGRFEITDLIPGHYAVSAWVEGHDITEICAAACILTDASHGSISNVELRLGPGVPVGFDTRGIPAGTLVTILDHSGLPLWQDRAGTAGFTPPRLAPGSYGVSTETPSGGWWRSSFTTGADGEAVRVVIESR
jgi:hypothetical protein